MLTPATHRTYIPARQQTTDDGFGDPVIVAAKSRTAFPCGHFFALGAPLYGRTGRGGRKACRLPQPVRQPRPVPLTQFGDLVRGSITELRRITMANLASGTHALAFQNTHFSVVDRNGQPWLRSGEIAKALGYSDASAINRIYARNSDEFTDAMTGSVKLTDPNGDLQETRIFSLRGAHLIAMFARTPVAKEFRSWVLDVLDREATVPAPAFYWRAEVLAADSTPSAPLPDELQSAINRRAWALSHDAYEILRLHLARRIAHTCEIGNLGTVDRSKALAIIAATTLNSALTPQHLNQLEAVEQLASRMARVAADVRKQLGGAA